MFFLWNLLLFKISNSNNLFKDFSAIPLRTTNLWSPATLTITKKSVNAFIYQKLVPIERLNRKGALSDLRHFFVAESPLKMMKNYFYFTSKTLFVLKIFQVFLSRLFGNVAKRPDKKDKINFKFYDVTVWLTNNWNTHIAQYLEELRQSENEI